MTIGDRIKARRIELNMTQEELAHKLGYKHKASINKIESNTQNPPQRKIVAFARALNTTPDALMGWSDNPVEYLEIIRKESGERKDVLSPLEADLIDTFRNSPHYVRASTLMVLGLTEDAFNETQLAQEAENKTS